VTAEYTFDELVDWLARQRDVPAGCAVPLAAVIAHYGRRLARPDEEEGLRRALIGYLDRAHGRQGRGYFDDISDDAELLLHRIEKGRGGEWPIVADTGGRVDHETVARFTRTHRVERGEGKHRGRSPTDENLLSTVTGFRRNRARGAEKLT